MSNLNIYLVSNPKPDYETYTDMLIAAIGENEARALSFNQFDVEDDNIQDDLKNYWVLTSDKDLLIVQLIGSASQLIEGIIKSWWKNG